MGARSVSANSKVLIIDAGNTSVKWAAFENDVLICIARDIQDAASTDTDEDCARLLAFKPDNIYFASVRNAEQEKELVLFIQVQFVGVSVHKLKSQERSCGVTNSYDDVSRLGVDRWLTVLAAFDQAQDTVVIDAGTALKVEFIPANGRYQGGYIVPGQAMMESMLVANTGKIRFNDADLMNYNGLINNTGLAVHLGCWEMTLALVERVYKQNEHKRFVFTGGNGNKIMQALSINAKYEPNLVVQGAKKLGDEWVSQK